MQFASSHPELSSNLANATVELETTDAEFSSNDALLSEETACTTGAT